MPDNDSPSDTMRVRPVTGFSCGAQRRTNTITIGISARAIPERHAHEFIAYMTPEQARAIVEDIQACLQDLE